MIIGISGKINSGKDLAGTIIQLLVSNVDNDSIIELLGNRKEVYTDYYRSDWKIIKFADKLKDIVCIILGCTREQLEDRVFKEKELDEEWWYYSNQIIHRIISMEEYNTLNYTTSRSYELIKLTPRLLFTLIGTECGRNIIHPNCWINATMNDYKSKFRKDDDFVHTELSDKSLVKWKDNPIWEPTHYPNWIITDLRFPNEAKSIKDRDGFIIRLQREPFKWIDTDTLAMETGKDIPHVKEHISETSLDNYQFDYTVDNNGTILDLIERIKEILLIEKII